jgi:hypothetical protein
MLEPFPEHGTQPFHKIHFLFVVLVPIHVDMISREANEFPIYGSAAHEKGTVG